MDDRQVNAINCDASFQKAYIHDPLCVNKRTVFYFLLIFKIYLFRAVLCLPCCMDFPLYMIFSFQFSSVAQSCLTLYNPMDCRTPGFPVHHQLLELTQTHVHRVSDAIQPSHPLFSLSSAFSLSQHQGLFQWVSSLIRWPKYWSFSSVLVLPMNIQNWFLLGWTGWISLQSKGLSRVFSNTTIQKCQFFRAQLSLWSNSHIHTWPLEKP